MTNFASVRGPIPEDVGHYLCSFGIRCEKNFSSAQPRKANYSFCDVFTLGVVGYALILTNNLKSFSTDGQRHFNLS